MYHETVVQVPPVVEADEPTTVTPEVADRVLIANQREEIRLNRSTIEAMNAELVRVRDDLHTAQACQREAEQELTNFKRRVTERMHREADRRQWCSEYDDIMEEMGLERRNRSWNVEVRVEATYYRTITAANEDRAEQLVLEEFPILSNRSYDFRGVSLYVTDVTTEVSQDD